jgi:hypothetical protein
VTIRGKAAQVAFSGLTPGYAGLYQVNAIVPSGITTGDAVWADQSGCNDGGEVNDALDDGIRVGVGAGHVRRTTLRAIDQQSCGYDLAFSNLQRTDAECTFGVSWRCGR